MSNKEKNEGNFDLSGVFHIQKNYLTDMSNSVTYEDVNNAPILAGQVLKLQEKIKDAQQSYKAANTSADSVLTEQQEMIDIIEAEKKRLDEKKILIDQAETNERRKALLTESNTLKKKEYTKLLLVLILCVVIHIVLLLIVKFFFTLPLDTGINTLFTLLHLFNFALWFIIAVYIFVNIQSRSHVNFNKIELPPPNEAGVTAAPATQNYSNIMKDLGLCYTDSCCGEKTTFDKTSGTCVSTHKPESSEETQSPSEETQSPSSEGFTTSSLTVLPQFLPGKNSLGQPTESTYGTALIPQPVPAPKPFDISSSSSKERKDYFKNQIVNSISQYLPNETLSEFADGNIDNSQNINNSQQAIDSLDENTANALDQFDTSTVKCHFTTMNDCVELKNSKNRTVYQPSNESVLLPKSDVLDHTMFYEGINSSENLTNTYSQYN